MNFPVFASRCVTESLSCSWPGTIDCRILPNTVRWKNPPGLEIFIFPLKLTVKSFGTSFKVNLGREIHTGRSDGHGLFFPHEQISSFAQEWYSPNGSCPSHLKNPRRFSAHTFPERKNRHLLGSDLLWTSTQIEAHISKIRSMLLLLLSLLLLSSKFCIRFCALFSSSVTSLYTVKYFISVLFSVFCLKCISSVCFFCMCVLFVWCQHR